MPSSVPSAPASGSALGPALATAVGQAPAAQTLEHDVPVSTSSAVPVSPGNKPSAGVTPAAPAFACDPSAPLLLAGTTTRPSGAVFKLAGYVGSHRFIALVDSGASGAGFISPSFAARCTCGLALTPSQNSFQLADGTVVSAAGQALVQFTLSPTKGAPVPFSSVFTATPLESYDIILGVGWLQEHDVLVGWRNRSLEIRTPGRASRHIRPIEVLGGEEPRQQLATISHKALRKDMRRGRILEAYAVLLREVQASDHTGTAAAPVSDHAGTTAPVRVPVSDPDVANLLKEFADVFPDKLPAELPPMRGVEHGIQLKPGSRPPPARPLRQQSSKTPPSSTSSCRRAWRPASCA